MFYKVLTNNRRSCHGGDLQWTPGEWVEVSGEIVPCENGLHFCADDQLIDWLHESLWEFEPDGIVTNAGDKLVCARGRITRQVTAWNERTARLFACDCAERVARLNSDPRVAASIAVARRCADGGATGGELAAARAAARAAAWDAAWAAARAAERAWQAARLMAYLRGEVS